MTRILVLALLLLLTACTYSQNLMNPNGQVVYCRATGWGIIGGTVAVKSQNDCIASWKQLGYVEVENIGVGGYFLREGNPPQISSVQAGWPAALSGMLPGDEIIEVNGNKVFSAVEVSRNAFCKPGDTVVFQIRRGGEIKIIPVKTIPKAKKIE